MNSLNQKKNIVLIGHSHIACFELLLKKKDFISRCSNFNFIILNLLSKNFNCDYYFDKKKKISIIWNENIKKKISNKNDNIIISSFGGNSHVELGFVKHDEPFDFILKEFPNLPINKKYRLLSRDEVEHMLSGNAGFPETIACLKSIDNFPNEKIYHIESPPPVFSNTLIYKKAVNFKSQFDKYGINDPFIRFKLWKLQSFLINDLCKKLRIEFVTSNRKIFLDNKSFLKKKYMTDFCHANEKFAEIIFNNIFKFND
jgi:hypothetical protein